MDQSLTGGDHTGRDKTGRDRTGHDRYDVAGTNVTITQAADPTLRAVLDMHDSIGELTKLVTAVHAQVKEHELRLFDNAKTAHIANMTLATYYSDQQRTILNHWQEIQTMRAELLHWQDADAKERHLRQTELDAQYHRLIVGLFLVGVALIVLFASLAAALWSHVSTPMALTGIAAVLLLLQRGL